MPRPFQDDIWSTSTIDWLGSKRKNAAAAHSTNIVEDIEKYAPFHFSNRAREHEKTAPADLTGAVFSVLGLVAVSVNDREKPC